MNIFSRFNNWVLGLLDGVFLTPMPVPLGGGERLEMVVLESRWTTVYPALLKGGLLSLMIGGLLGLIIASLLALLPVFQDMEGAVRGGVPDFPIWPLAAATTLLPAATLAVTWFWAEWDRQHNRSVVFTGSTWVARVEIPGVAYVSFGPTTLLEEAKLGSPGEKPGLENPSFLGRLLDAFLWRIRGIAYIFLPTRIFGAADRWEGVERGFNTLKIIIAIAGKSRERALLADTAAKTHANLRLEEERSGQQWLGVGGRAEEVLAALRRLLPEGPEVDLMEPELRDPGLWDRRTGRPVEAVEPAAAVPLVFPEA